MVGGPGFRRNNRKRMCGSPSVTWAPGRTLWFCGSAFQPGSLVQVLLTARTNKILRVFILELIFGLEIFEQERVQFPGPPPGGVRPSAVFELRYPAKIAVFQL